MATGNEQTNYKTQEYPPPDLPILPIFNTNDYPQTEPLSSGGGSGTLPSVIDYRLYQNLTYAVDDGYYGLAKDAYPLPDKASSGVKAVSTWTTRTTNNNNWRGICWSPQLALFCSVSYTGSANRAMTSPDGITWTTRTTNNNDWRAVCWSPQLSLFCAVSQTGTLDRVMTSPDGTTWTTRTTPNNNNYNDIIWVPELSLFVAIAEGSVSNAVMTSPNGITWTERTTPAQDWRGICWSPELSLLVAVSASGTNNRVMTSSNGINWSIGTTPNNNNYRGVCWSSQLGLFVAVSYSGNLNRAMTSPDGVVWTERTTNNNNWYSVVWADELGLFCAVAQSGTNDRVMTSPDGITWTTRTTNNNEWTTICWSRELGIFCATENVGTGNDKIMTSSLKGRPPTSYNVFNATQNSIDENGLWTMTLNEVKSTLTTASATPSFKVFSNNNTNELLYIENATGGAYNSVVSAGNNALIGGNTAGTGTFVIASRFGGYCGIRFEGNAIKIMCLGVFYYAMTATQHTFYTSGSSYVYIQTNQFSWTGVSDVRLKKDITDIEPSLDKICALRPVEYRFNDEDETTPKKAGLIAQEVLPIIPSVVSVPTKDNEYYGIKYTELIPYLIKSVQELKERVDLLKTKISA